MDRIKLKTIRLLNFESHADSTIELHEGFNAIQGQSCAGKSSILRSLRAVCIPREFCVGWVREGSDYCTIRVDSNVGYLIAEKGQGRNTFTYWIEGETSKPIVMKAPGDTAFEIASRIVGFENIRIESTVGKKKVSSRIPVNSMSQDNNLGLLGESGKLKSLAFDALCGIEAGEDVREGIKSTISEKKKKNDEYTSLITQVKSGGYPEKNIQDEREVYNRAVDLFEDSTGKKGMLSDMERQYGIWKSMEGVYSTMEEGYKGIEIPCKDKIEEFKSKSTDSIEKIGKIEGYNRRKSLVSNEIKDIELGINCLRMDYNKKDIQQAVIMARKLGYLQQYRVITDGIRIVSEEIEKNIIPEKNNDVNILVKKNNYCIRYESIADEVNRLANELEDLAVGVCIDSTIKDGIVAIESCRKYYKGRLSLEGDISAVVCELGRIEDELKDMNSKRMDVLGKIDICPVTGKMVTGMCSVYEEKQKGRV